MLGWLCRKTCPFLFTAACAGAMFVQPDLQTQWYVAFVAMSGCASTLHAFPSMARAVFRRPTYLEDIERPWPRESAYERELRHRFQLIFNNVMIATTSLTLGIIVEYAVYRYHSTTLNNLELLGVTGGLISIFGDVHTVIGKIIISVLDAIRKSHEKRRRVRQKQIEHPIPSGGAFV